MTDDIEHDIHVSMPPKRVEAATCGRCERLAAENARLKSSLDAERQETKIHYTVACGLRSECDELRESHGKLHARVTEEREKVERLRELLGRLFHSIPDQWLHSVRDPTCLCQDCAGRGAFDLAMHDVAELLAREAGKEVQG